MLNVLQRSGVARTVMMSVLFVLPCAARHGAGDSAGDRHRDLGHHG